MIWNPWKRIRQLEADNAYLADRLEYEREEMDERFSRILLAEIHHERQRYAMMEAQNARLMKSAVDLANMMPPVMFTTASKPGDQDHD